MREQSMFPTPILIDGTSSNISVESPLDAKHLAASCIMYMPLMFRFNSDTTCIPLWVQSSGAVIDYSAFQFAGIKWHRRITRDLRQDEEAFGDVIPAVRSART
jgi:hypothetical protein